MRRRVRRLRRQKPKVRSEQCNQNEQICIFSKAVPTRCTTCSWRTSKTNGLSKRSGDDAARPCRAMSKRAGQINRGGRPYNATKVVQKALWPVLDKLKIERCGLHAFRHTHSSLLLETGASPTVAQAQLRHSDPRITLGIYGHVIGDSQRNAVDRVAEILDPNGPKSVSSGQ